MYAMTSHEPSPIDASGPALIPLGEAAPGFRGVICRIDPEAAVVPGGLSAEELERRLLELGLVEGAVVEIWHQGPIRRDPIAVRINGEATFAMRRREANAILIAVSGTAG